MFGDTDPALWCPAVQPPLGQYRITVLLTGDDLGTDMIAWLAEKLLAAHGHTARVEQITTLGDRP
jgi:hypothetical protein